MENQRITQQIIRARAELIRIQKTDNGPLSQAICQLNGALVDIGVDLNNINTKSESESEKANIW